ncbi:unnamed protein product [Lactuca virosa]|uniref:CAND6/7 N-terminal domain-containing protein n=1 Tax=Lactuca virosa TaxID=75947 RepID=A0AAU9MH31_9ASTR|nr:unnamed protein product [Lactuca virosa]
MTHSLRIPIRALSLLSSKMRNLAKILTVLLLIFFVFTAPSTADIKSVKIRSDDRDLIVFEEFTFTHTGNVSVAISSVSVSSIQVTSNLSRPDLSRIGFFLVSDDALDYMYYYESVSCYLDSKYIALLFTFQDISPLPQSSFNKSYAVTYPNLYSLRFANCNPLSRATMDVRTELYNIHNGTTKDYLSAEQTMIPSIFFTFSIIYLCFLAVWVLVCIMNYRSAHWIHLLLGELLVMKGLNLLCAAMVQHSIKVTGTPPLGWNVFLYVFQFNRSVLFYTLIAVIFDGCSFLKRVFLANRTVMFVIPLQVFVTIASIAEMQVLAEESWDWGLGLYFADTFCSILLNVLIGFMVFETDRNLENYFATLSLIRPFYVAFIVYSCIACVLGIGSFVDYSSSWVMAVEIASLIFYIVMFFFFRPFEKNKYFDQLNLQPQVTPEFEL